MDAFKDLFIATTNFLKNLKREDDLTMKFPNFMQDCNNICSGYIYNYLFGCYKEPSIRIELLKQQLNILDTYDKLLHYMISVLIEDEIVSKTKNQLLINTNYNFTKIKEQEITVKHQLFRGTLFLLKHCTNHYKEALSGSIPALSVLYPEGKQSFLTQTLALDKAEYTEMPFFINTLVELIAKLSKNSALNILEIGGGSGMASKKIFNKITNNKGVSYHFTDIGRRFIIDMKHYLAENDLNFVTCSKFDITKAPQSQNLMPNNYDIIIGLDVVHATPDITQSLHNLKTILKPNGILCLLETTKAQRWHNLTMGLTKDWWNYNDKWRKNTPLLPTTEWHKVITASGFKFTYIYESGNKNSDAALIIASH